MITKRERLEKALKQLWNNVVGTRGAAVPVLIFGEQRSGTNMLLRCFGRCRNTAMYNETDYDAFVDYELRSLEVIRRLVADSPASHVVLKPTADGNRAAHALTPNASMDARTIRVNTGAMRISNALRSSFR